MNTDHLSKFIAARCVLEPKTVTTHREIYETYKRWMAETDKKAWTIRRFKKGMRELGFDPRPNIDGLLVDYEGLRLGVETVDVEPCSDR